MKFTLGNLNEKKKLLLLLGAFAVLTPIVVLSFSKSFDTRSSAKIENMPEKFKIADLNGKDGVTLADFDIWLSHFIQRDKKPSYYNKIADLDANNQIGLADFDKWLALFLDYQVWSANPSTTPTPPSTPANPTTTVGYVGNGKDGSITVASNTNLSTQRLSKSQAASCPDAPMYNVKSFASDGKSLETIEAIQTACLKKGDEILIINLQGTSTFVNNVGNWETLIVDSVAGHKITFTTKKSKFYGAKANDDSGIGVATNTQRVMVQRVPNYDNVTVNKGATLTVSAFTDRKKGGVVFFRAKGNVVVNGTISAAMSGYQGGVNSEDVKIPSPSGDSLFVDASSKAGYGGGLASQRVDGKREGQGAEIPAEEGKKKINGYDGKFSGGGGAGVFGGYWSYTQGLYTGTAGKGDTASIAAGGGGGGGAGNGGHRFWHSGHGGGGGGGGHATGGTGGVDGTAGKGDTCNVGGTGTATSSGAGGSAKFLRKNKIVNNPDTYDGYAGSGGGGAARYASKNLAKLFFGSGGGAGGTGTYGGNNGRNQDQFFMKGGNGARGGGIIFIAGGKITVTATGSITASGGKGFGGTIKSWTAGAKENAGVGTSGGGGGGAGGSIRLESPSLSIGTNKVVAIGGSGGIDKSYCGGGTGGVGVVALYNKASLQGASSPAATSISF